MKITKFLLVNHVAVILSAVGTVALLALPVSAQGVPLERETGAANASVSPHDDDSRIPPIVDGRFVLPPMQAASIATDKIGNGRTPPDFRDQNVTPMQSLPESASQRGEHWHGTVCNWAAPNTFSYPRYFEDRMLERHGHERLGAFQPLASGARFFATVPLLPYLGSIRHPCDCEFTVGYYRPGSCTPAMRQRPPYDRRAMIAESAAVATAILALP